MNKQLQRIVCLITSASVALPMIPLGTLRTFAQEKETFTWFTGVAVTSQNGDPMPTLVARDAEIRIGLSYEMPEDAADGSYSFSLPQAVTAQASTQSFSVPLGDTRTADVRLGKNGTCSITLSAPHSPDDPAVPGVPDAPDASTPAPTPDVPAAPDTDVPAPTPDAPDADLPVPPSDDLDAPDADVPVPPSDDLAAPDTDVPAPTPDVASATAHYTGTNLLNMGANLRALVAPVTDTTPPSPAPTPDVDTQPTPTPDSDTQPPNSGLLAGTIYFETKLDPTYLPDKTSGLTFSLDGVHTFEVAIPFENGQSQRAPSARANDFSANFVSLEIQNQNNTPLTQPAAKDADISAVFAYEIPSGGLAINTDYSFLMPKSLLGINVTSIPIHLDGVTVGTVTIDPATGDSSIRFTDASAVAGGTEGSFFMSSKFNKEEIPNGTTELTFELGPSKSFVQGINFLLDQIKGSVTITNNAELEKNESRVKWTVTVTPTLLNAEISPTSGSDSQKELQTFVVSNALNLDAQHTLFFDPTDNATYPTATKVAGGPDPGAAWTRDGNKLICTIANGDWETDDSYELVFYTKYDLGIFKDTEDKVDLTNSAQASFKYAQYKDKSSSSDVQITSAAQTATSENKSAKAEVSAMLLSKDQSYSKSTHKITWTLKINTDEVSFTNNLDVKDLLPPGLKLENVTIDGIPAAQNTDYSFTSGSSGSSGYEGGELVINQLSGDAAHVVTYVTEIDPVIWKTQSSKTFTNGVSYWGDYGTGYTFSRTKEATYNFGGASGGLIGGSGKYDATNHTFTWTIHVNNDTTSFTGGSVRITIPNDEGKAQTFRSCTTTNLDSAIIGSYNGTDRTVTVTLDNTDITGTLTVITEVDDPNHWAANRDSVDYSITANLTADDNIDLTAAPTAKTTSEVIAKSSDQTAGYDFNKKEITWKVAFNQNKMAMTNPVITDILPAGLSYVDSSAAVTSGATIKNVSYDPATRRLDISFENISVPVSTIPTLTFKTLVTDEQLLRHTDSTSTSAKINNTASIAFDEMPAPLHAPATLSSSYERTVGSRPLSKAGTHNAQFRNYTWTVGINPNQIAMTTPKLEDQLAENLILDLQSVQLYEAVVHDTTGKLTKGTLVYDGSNPAAYPGYTAMLDGQTFTFMFAQDISKAYLLIFETDNMNPANATYANSVMFVGEANSGAGLIRDITQAAASGGSTNPNRGAITLIAKDQSNNRTLAGVKYTVTGKTSGFTHTLTTGSTGKALFTPLKFETYQVTEDLSGVAGGYAALQSPPTYTISATDKSKSETLLYSKGNAVTLDYNSNASDTTGTTPAQKSYASGATISVLDNPFTRTHFVFTGWNTKADGNGVSYDPADTFTLSANTTLYAQWKKAAGSIKLTAKSTDTVSVLFQDLSYTLKSDYPGALPITKTTDAAGTITFDVDLGTYTLETQPLSRPAGYIHQSTDKTTFPILMDGDTDAAVILYEPGFSLSYDGNGHTSGITPDVTYHPSNASVPTGISSPFTKVGYDFTGWNTAADGSGTSYTAGAPIVMIADTVLYATWVARPTGGTGGGGGSGGSGGGGGTSIPSGSKPGGSSAGTPQPAPSAPGTPIPPVSQWSRAPRINVRSITRQALARGTGGLVLSSAEAGNGSILPGVVFAITTPDGVVTAITDHNGVVAFPDLKPGSYTVKVAFAPDGYEFDVGDSFEVNVNDQNWTSAEALFLQTKALPSTGDGVLPLAVALIAMLMAFAVCAICATRKSASCNDT